MHKQKRTPCLLPLLLVMLLPAAPALATCVICGSSTGTGTCVQPAKPSPPAPSGTLEILDIGPPGPANITRKKQYGYWLEDGRCSLPRAC